MTAVREVSGQRRLICVTDANDEEVCRSYHVGAVVVVEVSAAERCAVCAKPVGIGGVDSGLAIVENSFR